MMNCQHLSSFIRTQNWTRCFENYIYYTTIIASCLLYKRAEEDVYHLTVVIHMQVKVIFVFSSCWMIGQVQTLLLNLKFIYFLVDWIFLLKNWGSNTLHNFGVWTNQSIDQIFLSELYPKTHPLWYQTIHYEKVFIIPNPYLSDETLF